MPQIAKQQIPIAAPKKVKFNLDSQHITTTDFMQLQPVYYRHVIPGEKISVNIDSKARLAPLAVPTYGRANLNLRGFFVPYRTVFTHWNEFIADTVAASYSTTSLVNNPPRLSFSTLTDFADQLTISTEITPYNNEPYDFSLGYSPNIKYYKFTKKGRLVFKILNSLGYRLIPHTTLSSTNPETWYNALGILAFMKIYLDWYSLSQYQNSALYLRLQKLLSYNDPSIPLAITKSNLNDIFDLVTNLAYNQDFITSQWDNPVAPVSGLNSSFTLQDITDPTYISTGVSNLKVDNTTLTNHTTVVNAKTFNNLTEHALHLLHQLNNYSVRHQFSGARSIDRMLAEYGIQLKAEKLNRSVYLGNSLVPLEIGDVTSMADTSSSGEPSNLGDFAGRGRIIGNSSFEYEAEEFGMFCICASVVPAIDYVQGVDRNNLHINKLDFFTHEFDNCGVQVCSKAEMYVSPNQFFIPSTSPSADYLKASGFLPRYYEYKLGRSVLSGDLASPNANIGKDSWHLFRLFNDAKFTDLSGVVHSADLCLGSDSEQYDRIFQNTDSDFDHFFMFYNFNVNSFVPALPLYDTYVFENEEDHARITMEPNGSKLN